ncbi:odorant receptor 49b-like [Solenopsis invicta]|uniref:odorant receptor 49b-like n=1 Tax=Solenopsis invicta TaxID=13686 RepID=UPI00193E96B2|nr:odorant receptor 49b-like [Solenopsis invicta]
MSTSVAQGVYESLWYNQDKIFQKNLLFVSKRSQIPIVVSVSSILPVLSLEFYALYVSTAFSYLMTMRIVFVEDN